MGCGGVGGSAEFGELGEQGSEVLGEGGGEGERGAFGLGQLEAFGVEGEAGHDRTFFAGTGGDVVAFEFAEEDGAGEGVVEGVDEQGEADGLEVDADLVGFAGLGEAAEEGGAFELPFDFPGGQGGASMAGDAHAELVGGVRADGGVDGAGGAAGASFDEGEVLLLDGVVLELVGEVALGGGVEGEEQDAGGVLVEAVDDADAGVGGAGAGEAELLGEELEDGGGLATAGDHGDSGGLVDGDEVVGTVEEGEHVDCGLWIAGQGRAGVHWRTRASICGCRGLIWRDRFQ